LISNDGGFAAPATLGIACNDRYSWTLASTGPERLPKTYQPPRSPPFRASPASTPTRAMGALVASWSAAGHDRPRRAPAS